SIGYHKTAEGFQGKVETKIVFRNDTGIIAQDHYILETPLSQSIEDAGKQNIIDLHRYMLPGEGKIYMELTLTDRIGAENLYYKRDSFIVEKHENTPFYSSLQLLDTSFLSTQSSIFQKNDRQQIPLSAGFLDDNRDRLHY